jgi:SAM-dependent methyltransferase
VLDIASNCGYWSARYAERGARSLVAVEGRAAYVEQGNLYWSENRFLQPGRFEFLQGDVTATPTWEALAARGPYDLALCLGILYHIPDYRQLLRRLAAVTGEAILVDTRVDADPAGNAGAEALVEEPGGWFFDAIVETRRNRVPVLPRLVETLEELGFAVERLATEARTPAGLKGKDDYNEGRRVALLACRR